eukprot:GHRQ01029644.1.p1 GENE.GHRQ01029644.1~~GHRQ01029644.1.p1  ORF type:complete len:125 (-),score=24.24 GHRQ01029644.1:117-491(-)
MFAVGCVECRCLLSLQQDMCVSTPEDIRQVGCTLHAAVWKLAFSDSSVLPLLHAGGRHFAAYLEEDIGADDLEELYQKVSPRGWGWLSCELAGACGCRKQLARPPAALLRLHQGFRVVAWVPTS